MAEQNYIGLRHVGAAFAKAERAAAAGVDDDARAAVIPDEVAGGGALVLELGSAGAENLNGEGGRAAGLGDCGQDGAEKEKGEGKERIFGRALELVHDTTLAGKRRVRC
jgi:hypothetical protein